MMRVILFLFTNLAVIIVFGIILILTGIKPNSLYSLMIISTLFGFSGSILSLLMSKWIAIKAVNGKLVTVPLNNREKWLVTTIKHQSSLLQLKTPKIVIYPSLDINAFATGPHKNASLIALSSGLLKNMNKEEVEAVIAHEMTHIKNGDMVTMTLIQGVINTFVIFVSRIIASIITNIFNNKEENNKYYNNSIIYILITGILELIFGVIASLITMWFSRYREFYADAGSAKLVGRKKMIAALKKIKTSYEPTEDNSIIAFCINGKSKSIFNLFMSHPPIDQRIIALYNKKYM
ncbi:protease HtpX [Buchnera aphidicola]|uniref:protease HtpX n=1 Tax=Buchnera aphidicola TaxID=9 RepID=UPI0031B7047C